MKINYFLILSLGLIAALMFFYNNDFLRDSMINIETPIKATQI